jgi:hypothetical protein
MKRIRRLSRCALFIGIGFLLGLIAIEAADNLNLQAKLIWGTNDGKPNDPNLSEVEPGTAEKLRGVFKWKYYFEVSRTNFTVNAGAMTLLKMSRKCDVKVRNLGKSKVAVELYGEGKLLVQKRQPIKPGELLVLAGDDKNDTAWFVILTLQER